MKQFNHITIRFTLILFLSSLILRFLYIPIAIAIGYFSTKNFYKISGILEKGKFFSPAIVIGIYTSLIFTFFVFIFFFNDPNGFEEMLHGSLQIIERSGYNNTEQIGIIKDYLNNSTVQILLTYCTFFTLFSLILTTSGGYVSYLKCKLKNERINNVR